MKRTITLLLTTLLCILLPACSSGASAPASPSAAARPASQGAEGEPAAENDLPKLTLKAAWNEPLDPESHPQSLFFNTLKEEMDKADVNVTVELYPSGQLGDAASHLKQVQEGILQMAGSLGAGQFATDFKMTDYLMFDVPYQYDDFDSAMRVYDESQVCELLRDEMIERTGVRQLFNSSEGFRVTTNSKREIRTPGDYKGLKIRTMQNSAHMAMFNALGAMPTPIAYTELYTALQTGVVDGQENPLLNIELQKFYEIQKYLTIDNHLIGAGGVVVNEAFYQSLAPRQREALDAAVEKGKTASREKAKRDNEQALQKLIDAGMQVYIPTPEEMELFREATRGPVLEHIRSNMEHPERLDQYIEEADRIQGR